MRHKKPQAFESVSYFLRKLIMASALFPSDDAAIRLLYLGLCKTCQTWTMALGHLVPIQNWKQTTRQYMRHVQKPFNNA